MITSILAFLAAAYKYFSPLANITNKIIDLQIKKADAKTEQERIAADERLKTLEARRDVMVAEAGLGLNAWMRFALAVGPAAFLLKVFIWDKVLKLGTTDALDANLWQVVIAVIGFYFLYDIAARWKR
jgi:hypothetical protein